MASKRSARLRIPRAKALIAFAALALLGGSALYLCWEWSTGIGEAGIVRILCSRAGIALAGLGILIIGIWLTMRSVANLRDRSPEERREVARQTGRQLLTVLLNAIVYGGTLIIAMGCISALDGASIGTVIGALMVLGSCIAGFVAYRRYRSHHKASYSAIGSVGVSFALLAIGAGMLSVGSAQSFDAARDLAEGPRSADTFLVDAKIDEPYWSHRLTVQPTHVLTFYDADGSRIVLEVPDADVDSAKVINDHGNFVHLAYYPHTNVFCSASKWDEGRRAMGEDLLSKLNETYDFDLPE